MKMREYLISVGILAFVFLILYTLFSYNKFMVKYEEEIYNKCFKNKLIIIVMSFIKTSIVFFTIFALVHMIKITIFG